MCKPGMASPTALEESYTQKKEPECAGFDDSLGIGSEKM